MNTSKIKKIILDQDAYISSSEYYEASAHFDGEEKNTLKVHWEILPDNLDDNGEPIEREADEDCNWDAPVYIYDDGGVNIYDGYYDEEKFDQRFTLDRYTRRLYDNDQKTDKPNAISNTVNKAIQSAVGQEGMAALKKVAEEGSVDQEPEHGHEAE